MIFPHRSHLQCGLVVLLSILLPRFAGATTTMVQVGPGGGRTFVPATVTIAPGDTVQWDWASNFHSVTSGTEINPDGLFDSGVQNVPFTFTHTFPDVGSFPYFCVVHGQMMSGTVNVVVATPTPTVSPTPVTTPTPGCGDTVFLAPSKDNTLYQDAAGHLSNGQGIYFFDGRTGTNLVRRGLIAFDLSSIPTNATITGATLSMFLSQANGGAQAVSLSTVSQNWGEGPSDAGDPGGVGTQAAPGDATWLHTFYNTIFWTTPGGDFSPTISASTTVNALDTTYTWSGSGLIADVQAWVSNPAGNFGWVIRGNEITAGMAQRFNSRENSNNPPQLMVTYQLLPCTTPTPTPTPPVNISGVVRYCSNPALNPVPGVTITVTGGAGGSTSTDGAGSYNLSLPYGGNYTVTPSKAALPPGATGINTVDVVAIQRHFLVLGTPLTGCRLQAADVNGIGGVNTVDVVAVQRYFLVMPTGIANVGKYQFNPVNRTYSNLVTDQSGQDYNALVLGDVATSFVH